MKLNLGLLALAVGAFAIGVTEFGPMGLLPVIAGDLNVSIPAAGIVVSAYAFGVMIAAPLVTLSTGRVPRRTLLMAMSAIFILGSILSALSTSYEMLILSRVFTSINHGAFFGVGSIVAAGLAAPERRAAAVATMFMGLTLANIIGVPAATWVGQYLGWRAVFWGIAAIGVVQLIGVRLALPDLPGNKTGNVGAELRVLMQKNVLTPLLLTVMSNSAVFTVLTYIAPILQTEANASINFVTIILLTAGVGMTLGSWLGGKFADISVDRTIIGSLCINAIMLGAFALFMSNIYVSGLIIFVWGAASFALVPPIQVRIMSAASGAPSLASAVNIGAFNLGNAIGAVLGGWVIDASLGYPAVAFTGAAIAVISLIIAVFSRGHTPSADPRPIIGH
ncbi:MFS transporter [Biostraticola tofi]|uniref:DHA1 family inner membrane transport protein n=1 Tax=Biostraticola tofi TaxID=466109 RepID=A0A4R3YWF0_9GAMM|nr:MFS transporter [Biostraticola tofi]TCV96832.1 DHA1 family inner membrane transport protein [Biostraticola tofi]